MFKYSNNTPSSFISINLDHNRISAIALDSFYFSSHAKFLNISMSNNTITSIPNGMFSYPSVSSIFIDLSYKVIIHVR